MTNWDDPNAPEEPDESDVCHHGVGFDEYCEDCDDEEEDEIGDDEWDELEDEEDEDEST